MAMKLGARKWDFDASIGIHPTVSEVRRPAVALGGGMGENPASRPCRPVVVELLGGLSGAG